MSEEEQNELFKKAFANTLRKLAEEPEELFDNNKLQKKYNNLLKEQIKLKQELQQKENIIKEVREYIEHKASIRECYMINGKEYKELLEILNKDITKKSDYNYEKVEKENKNE